MIGIITTKEIEGYNLIAVLIHLKKIGKLDYSLAVNDAWYEKSIKDSLVDLLETIDNDIGVTEVKVNDAEKTVEISLEQEYPDYDVDEEMIDEIVNS